MSSIKHRFSVVYVDSTINYYHIIKLRSQISKGIRQWAINWYTFPMMKSCLLVDKLLNCRTLQILNLLIKIQYKPIYLSQPKILCGYKTLGTIVIYSPMSLPSQLGPHIQDYCLMYIWYQLSMPKNQLFFSWACVEVIIS